jgi:polysaccharide biosynthesis/export protein
LDLRRSQAISVPDLIDVEVASTLPGHPIRGERLVRPDGKITLGYYGDIHVAGLMPGEAKAKIVVHLRRYLSDEALGLIATVKDADGKSITQRLSPYETDGVAVRMNTKNARVGVIEKAVYEIRLLLSRI